MFLTDTTSLRLQAQRGSDDQSLTQQTQLQASKHFQSFSPERQTLVEAMITKITNDQEPFSPSSSLSQDLQDQFVAIALLDQESNYERLVSMRPEQFRAHLVASLAARTKAEKELLETLSFPVMMHRYEDISDAYGKTCEWIFQKEPTGPWSSLPDWLISGSGIYWIKGIPASGKSTIMKYIFDHPRT